MLDIDAIEIGKRIKERRKELDLTLEQLADTLGFNKSTLQRYEAGKVKKIKIPVLHSMAKVLKVDPNWLALKTDEKSEYFIETEVKPKLLPPTITDNVVTFPVLGTIAVGYDEMALEDWSGDTVEIPVSYLKGRPQSDFFVLSVHGNSMYPLYHDGDKVLILKQSSLDNSGQIGAIIYDDECATLKKIEFVQGEDWLRMIPINPEFVPKTITGVDLEHCRVIGVPKFLIREIQ